MFLFFFKHHFTETFISHIDFTVVAVTVIVVFWLKLWLLFITSSSLRNKTAFYVVTSPSKGFSCVTPFCLAVATKSRCSVIGQAV